MSTSEFHREFIRRTRRYRLHAGFDDMKEFATFMGVSYARYAKYETRSPLPHYLIPKFCKLTGTSVTKLFDMEVSKQKTTEGPHRPFAIAAK